MTKAAWGADVDGHSGRRFVLLALADCHNEKTGECFPSVETLCGLTLMAERAIRQHLRDLESSGYVTRIFGRGRRTDYTLHPARFRSWNAASCVLESPAKNASHTKQSVQRSVANSCMDRRQKLPKSPANSANRTGSEQESNGKRGAARKSPASPTRIPIFPEWDPPTSWIQLGQQKRSESRKPLLTEHQIGMLIEKFIGRQLEHAKDGAAPSVSESTWIAWMAREDPEYRHRDVPASAVMTISGDDDAT